MNKEYLREVQKGFYFERNVERVLTIIAIAVVVAMGLWPIIRLTF